MGVIKLKITPMAAKAVVAGGVHVCLYRIRNGQCPF
jgi:hypothetical protein